MAILKYRLFNYQLLAGRFSRSSWLLKQQVKEFALKVPDVQFFTEVSDRHKWDSLIIDGYQNIHSVDNKGASECAINVRSDQWDVLFWESRVLTEHRFFTTRGTPRALINSLTAVIQDKEKVRRPIVLSMVHLPSSVEGYDKSLFSKVKNRVIAWVLAVSAWKKYIRGIRKEYKTRNVLCVADFNLNIKKFKTRRYIKSVFRLYHFTFRHPYPKRGDLGKRLITYGLYRGL